MAGRKSPSSPDGAPAASGPRPAFGASEARTLVGRLYGLEAEVRELAGERDRNFHVRSVAGDEFVLKISNALELKEFLDCQNRVLDHLRERSPELGVPRLRCLPSGPAMTTVRGPSGTEHFVRLLMYLPGRFLSQVKPHHPELLLDLGRFLGSLDRALAGFAGDVPGRELLWDMRQAPQTVRGFLGLVADPERRRLIEQFLERYQAEVLPRSGALRQGLIYNDANDNNVLVGHAGGGLFGRFRRVTGVIDFGDMVQGWTVVEPAVAAAYAMMGKNDPLDAAARVAAGFHSVLPLTGDELACFFDFICMRLCLSVVIAAEQHSRERDNAYLRVSEDAAWGLLGRLREIHPRLAHYTLRDACGLPACPHSPDVARWLEANAGSFGPVVEPDPRAHPPLVFDLGAGSLDLGRFSYSQDPGEVEALIAARLQETGRKTALGRYNEARTAYTGRGFEVRRDDAAEMRTVHLGIDLFLPPGSPVLAPLDGEVHSLADNAASQDYGPTVILEHHPADGPAFYSLYGHLSRTSLAALRKGAPLRKGERFAAVGPTSENGGWPPHLHFQVIADMLGFVGDFPGATVPSRRSLWLSLCPDPNLVLGLPADAFPPPGPGREDVLARRRELLGPALSVSYRRPLKIVRGLGTRLFDEDGQAYLDGVNNVPHVGHSHPRVASAIAAQAAVLNTNTRYLHDVIVEYARRLAGTLPEPLRVFFFVNSGSEANDLALRLAWSRTNRRELIVVEGAYHGNLSSLIDISPYKFDGPGGRGAPPHVRKAALPDAYRGPYKAGDAEAGRKYARSVEEAVARLAAEGRPPAGFICESLLSCAGQIVLPPGYLETAYRAVRGAGGVCIADEVQVGFGRVGTHFWGFETQGVVPDIVTLGKPIGNGHPLGAVVTTPEIAASFHTGMEYFNTYGGNPVSCAAGLAVLDVIRDEKLQENALHTGAHLRAGLLRLKERFPLIGDVRGPGLFLGVELVRDRDTLEPAPEEASYVVERLRDKRVLTSTDGLLRNVIKIKPPLPFRREDADVLLERLAEVLSEDALSFG